MGISQVEAAMIAEPTHFSTDDYPQLGSIVRKLLNARGAA